MKAETSAYRTIARGVARWIGADDSVLGVYVRRSVASGEVAFGRSDIDFHAIVAPFGSPEAEGAHLLDLARRVARLRRAVPCLGHFDVSTRVELDRWYRGQPAQWYRDRGWLRLHGEEYERPRLSLDATARRRALWWYFWAAQLLPDSYRAGNARRCFNLVLDMFDAHRLLTGPSGVTLTRRELAELWFRSGSPSAERRRILRAHRSGFRDRRGETLEPLYRESLALHDALHPLVIASTPNVRSGRLESRVPPTFSRRSYLVVEAGDRDALASALADLRRDPSLWVLTAAGLELYLALRNPWEHAPLAAANPDRELVPPAPESFHEAIDCIAYPEIPRHFGFVAERRHVGPLYAQARLYRDEAVVAGGPDELARAYTERYGRMLRSDGTRSAYFSLQYPAIRRVVETLAV